MSEKTFRDLPVKFGKQQVEIDHVLLVKFGCVCVKGEAYRLPATHGGVWLWDKAKGLSPYDHIIQALEKQANIFDLRTIEERDQSIYSTKDHRMLVDGNLFSLRVNLPLRMQKYREETASCIEEFAVVSSGSLFAAFTEARDYPTVTYMAHEYREIVRAQIDKEMSFEHISLGPSPIHPDFYIVVPRKGEPQSTTATGIYSIDQDIFVVMEGHGRSDIEMVTDLFDQIRHELLDFYEIKMHEVVLGHRYMLLTSEFSELGDGFKRVLQTSSWVHPFRRVRLASSARASLSNIHISLVEHETLLLEIDKDKSHLFAKIKESKVLSDLYGYFHQLTESEFEIPKSLSPALEHFSGELETFRNIQAVVIATIAGAAIGALLTALFTRSW